MRLKGITFLLLFGSTRCVLADPEVGDGVSYSLIFAEKYVGTVSCNDITSSSYCENEISIYNSNGTLEKAKIKIQPACLTGPSECDAHALLTEVKPLSGNEVLARTQAQTGKTVWVKIKKITYKI